MTANRQGRRWARGWPWAVPVVTAGIVVAGFQLMSPASAATHPNLPTRTAAQLLAAVQTSTTQALSGTVVESAALGLPSLPGADNSASLSWQSLVIGSHTARVWVAGPDKQRVALLGTLSESDVIHDGNDVWTYTSSSNEVTHTVLPAHDSSRSKTSPPDAVPDTPMSVANQILKAIDPSTRVTVDSTRVVAGHAAYTLMLVPRDTRSTIKKVTIALDSKHFVPLQVQVFGSGSKPAFQIGFSRGLSFATPSSSVFQFHVPAGATTTTNPLIGREDHGRHGNRGANAPTSAPRATATGAPKVIGSGWTTIAYFAHGLPTGSAGGLLDQATNPVGSSGDRMLSTSLLNVLFTKDGRVFLGAVTPSVLEQAAATTPR
ncbi:MAG: outer membrane lipoprotein carrier protein LolA [Jatrophihabitantaceae bacterium]